MYPILNSSKKTYRVSTLNGGIVIDKKETEMDENKSPDMLNMIYDGNVLRKREGQKILFEEKEDIISCFSDSFYNYIIYHAADKLKAFDLNTKEYTVLKTRLSLKEGVFFSYNGYVYYIGSGEYYKVEYKDGLLSATVVDGYIPTVFVNCTAEGIGDKNEEFNFLTGGFKASYNTTNESVIKTPLRPLDETKKIIVSFGGNIIDSSFYTVDYATGTITFKNSLQGGHNLLTVTAYTKENIDRQKIVNCNACEIFGGTMAGLLGGTRVFLSGNREYANTFFYSGLKNPEYFPVNQFEILGDIFDPITCMGKQYNSLVFFKENSMYISLYTYEDSTVNFTVSEISDCIGCDSKKSLVSIDNQLVWLNSKYGVMTLCSTSIKDEKNIRCISENINGNYSKNALLNQKNLNDALGFVNRGKYYLVTDKYTYVLNMKSNFSIGISSEKMSWFLYDNVCGENCFFVDREVYLVNKKRVSYFTKQLYDFYEDTPIKAHVRTKALDFGLTGEFKFINDISFYLGTMNNSYVKTTFMDENGRFKKEYEFSLSKFNFLNFSFDKFTFYSNLFSMFIRRKILRRNCMFLTIIFENSKENSQMAISDIIINYNIERGARYNGI